MRSKEDVERGPDLGRGMTLGNGWGMTLDNGWGMTLGNGWGMTLD